MHLSPDSVALQPVTERSIELLKVTYPLPSRFWALRWSDCSWMKKCSAARICIFNLCPMEVRNRTGIWAIFFIRLKFIISLCIPEFPGNQRHCCKDTASPRPLPAHNSSAPRKYRYRGGRTKITVGGKVGVEKGGVHLVDTTEHGRFATVKKNGRTDSGSVAMQFYGSKIR